VAKVRLVVRMKARLKIVIGDEVRRRKGRLITAVVTKGSE